MRRGEARTAILAAAMLMLAACGSDLRSGAVDDTSLGDATTTTETTTTTTTLVDTTTTELVTTVPTTETPATPAPTPAPTSPPTKPPSTAAPTQPPATQPPTGPIAVSFEVSRPAACPAPDAPFQTQPEVTVRWEFKQIDSLYVAIDNQDGPYETGLAPKGEAVLPYACPGPHTYYVVAEGAGKKVVKSAQR